MSYQYTLTEQQEEQLKHRTTENEKLGIERGYSVMYNYDHNDLVTHYFAKCGFSSNSYGYTYDHVKKCMICKRLLGLSNSQVTNRHEVLIYFLLDKEIKKYPVCPRAKLFNKRDEFDGFSMLFESGISAIKKGNIIYRNYEYTDIVRGGYYGNYDNAYRAWNYIDLARKLGLYEIRICDIPLDTIRNMLRSGQKIVDIEIIEPKQQQYYNYYTNSGNLTQAKIKEKDSYIEDRFFKVHFVDIDGNKTIRSFIWQFDETAKCLIEVSNECKNYQEGLLFLYPKEIKNRQGTLRQGEYFLEPTDMKFTKQLIDEYKGQRGIIIDKKGNNSNHFATRRIPSMLGKDQYVTGTIRHFNKDHRMLKLKDKVWYKVHQSNALNAWSINLRRGSGGD